MNRKLSTRTMAIPFLTGLAMYANHQVPPLTGPEPALGHVGMNLMTIGTIWAIARRIDPVDKPSVLESITAVLMALGPFAFHALNVRSGILGFFAGIYQTLPQLLIACALGLVPEVVSRIRRTRTPTLAN